MEKIKWQKNVYLVIVKLKLYLKKIFTFLYKKCKFHYHNNKRFFVKKNLFPRDLQNNYTEKYYPVSKFGHEFS